MSLMIAKHLVKLPLSTHTRNLYCEFYDSIVRYHIPFHTETIHRVTEIIPTANGLTIIASRTPPQRYDLAPATLKVE
jgi:hypothetical protein